MKWIFSYIKPYKAWFAVNVVCLLLKTIISIVTAYFVQWLVQSTVDGNNLKDIYNNIIYLSIFITAGVAITYISNYSNGKYGNGAVNDMKNHLAKHIRDLTVSELDNSHSGDMVSRMNNDISQIQEFIRDNISSIIYLPLMGISAAIYMMTLNWKLLLLSFILTPPSSIAASRIRKKIDVLMKKHQDLMGKGNSVIQDMIGGIGIVKSFHIEKEIHKKYSHYLDLALETGFYTDKIACSIMPFYIIMAEFPRVVCLLAGGLLAINGNLQLGALIAFLQLLGYVIEPASAFPYIMLSLSNTQGSVERIMETLNKPLERTNGINFIENQGSTVIQLKNIHFSYRSGQEILKGLNMKIKNGYTHAIVGSSGSGKSTILKLLCSFYETSQGEIELYEKSYSLWSLENLRRNYAIVSQDVYLFPGSIHDNIAYGKMDATEDEIINAAKAAYAHEFITNFKEGYNTMVGERGVRLSGGQRQRISIARAILKDAPILLLDEPTSALDTDSEKIVQKALDEFMKNRTVIVVAHRMSTIMKADKIFVLDKGILSEEGTHEELISKKGTYFELYKRQFEDNSHSEEEAG